MTIIDSWSKTIILYIEKLRWGLEIKDETISLPSKSFQVQDDRVCEGTTTGLISFYDWE